jgi:hypothetical protein
VNYFSHFVVDRIPGRFAHNAALFFPDVCKRWIASFHKPPPSPLFTANQNDMLLGCIKHYQADKRFHQSSFFHHYNTQTLEALKRIPFSEEFTRIWFVSHVLFELLLDRQWVAHLPHELDAFYESITTIDEGELIDYLKHYGLQDTQSFLDFWNHFKTVKYIYYYTDNRKLLYSLSRIMMRVGLKEPNQHDSELLLNAIPMLELDLFPDKEALYTQLKKVFE